MKILEKSLWLESGKTVASYIVQLFEDVGIVNNHKFIVDINSMDKLEKVLLIDKIVDADQICFESSLVGNSLEIIEDLVSGLGYMGVRGKRFVVLADLVYALNSGYILPKASKEGTFFNNNDVYQIEEGKLKRVVYNFEKFKFELW